MEHITRALVFALAGIALTGVPSTPQYGERGPRDGAGLARQLQTDEQVFVGRQPNGLGRPCTIWSTVGRFNGLPNRVLSAGPSGARGPFHFYEARLTKAPRALTHRTWLRDPSRLTLPPGCAGWPAFLRADAHVSTLVSM